MNFLLHRKIAICMLFIALTGLGYVSYKQLPVELLPNAELPMLFVQVTSAQDMDPSYVESEVVIPIEGAIGTIGGVEQIESLIDSRQSSIKIDFKSNINFKITALKLQEKINEIASSQYRYKRSMFRCLPVASCRSRCVDRVVRTGFVT
jgi:multidrug efflux pump subunit AcrB